MFLKLFLCENQITFSCLSDVSLVISMAVIGVVGVMSFFVFAVCFFLRRPGKMPAVLVSQLRDFKIISVSSKPKVLEQASFRVLKRNKV